MTSWDMFKRADGCNGDIVLFTTCAEHSYTVHHIIPLPYHMGRRRGPELVLAVEEGIDELVIHHRPTRRGTQTTEKVVPVVIPEKIKPGESSKTKKGKMRQVDPNVTNSSKVPIGAIQYLDEQAGLCPNQDEDYHPDPEDAHDHPEANVCVQFSL